MAQAQAGFQQSFPQTVDIPLSGMPLQRGTSTNDQRYVNVFFESYNNPLTGGKTIYCIKRPGLANFSQPPAGAATGRGLYYWGATGKLYSVFANKVYSNTTDLGVTLAASTGRVWWCETAPTASTQLLIMSDGTDNYNIQTNDTITQIDQTDDAQYPQNNLGPIVMLDTYIFQGQADGEIWNSEVDDYDSWDATGVVSSEQFGDDLEAIAQQKEQLVAFGKRSTEFFFDNANSGSPLQRIVQNSFQVGMASRVTLCQSGDILIWVSECASAGDGGRSVWILDGLSKLKNVGIPTVNRFLAAEGSSISSATAWIERVAGHLLYVLNLSSANRTFVYDIDENMWCEWEIAAGGAKFNGIAATSGAGTIYIQDATNGRIYTMSPTTYQDSAANFTVTIQTDNYWFGSPMIKFQAGLWVIGDNTTGSLSVTEADDDYTTFNTARTIDLSTSRKFLAEGGAFFSRAYRLTYADNYPLRLTTLSLNLTMGDV